MKPNSHIAPFLAQPVNLKVGLNHLGYRNAAEDLFTTLLPGLNNVTARIRYYSFYCWLLDKFFSNNSQPTVGEYNRFIRNAEYLLAILHTGLPDSGGIPGIDYALNVMDNKPDVVDLGSGTYQNNDTSRGTYWANPGGVLRQYYGSSLNDIGITVPSQKIPGINDISTEGGHITGKDLADYFEESIGRESSMLFLDCINNGLASQNEREKLLVPFTMKGVFGNEMEREILIDMLLQDDYPGRSERAYRRGTIQLYLEFCSNSQSAGYSDELGFPKYLYERYLSGERDNPCIIGWYCFYLNDSWQYQASIIFERILDILQKDKHGRWVKLEDLSSEIAVSVSQLFDAEDTSLEDILARQNTISGKDNIGRIAAAISCILDHYVINFSVWPQTNALAGMFNYSGADDFCTAAKFIDAHKKMSFKDFVKYFIESKIVFRHYNVSLRKFYQTGIASHKFMLEDGYIRYLKDTITQATHTSPRLVTLKGFLSDLDLVHENKLTEKGKKILSKIS